MTAYVTLYVTTYVTYLIIHFSQSVLIVLPKVYNINVCLVDRLNVTLPWIQTDWCCSVDS